MNAPALGAAAAGAVVGVGLYYGWQYASEHGFSSSIARGNWDAAAVWANIHPLVAVPIVLLLVAGCYVAVKLGALPGSA